MTFRDLVESRYGYSVIIYTNEIELEELEGSDTYGNVKIHKTFKDAAKEMRYTKALRKTVVQVDIKNGVYTGVIYDGNGNEEKLTPTIIKRG